jgi:ubiquitin-conjugating enzyme E2 D/E
MNNKSQRPNMLRRLKSELDDFSRNVEQRSYDLEIVNDDMLHWHIALKGPQGTPYEGGTFLIDIVFPQDYPLTAPTLKFLTKIYHPNISSKGQICIPELDGEWSPIVTVDKIIDTIISLLCEPNTSNPIVVDLANQFDKDRKTYLINAKEYTIRHAM